VSIEQGTKPEGADPAKAPEGSPANPQGNGMPEGGQPAPAGTQSGLTEQEIAEYRAWKDALGNANVTSPRELVADYTRKSQRAAELEGELAREREALDVLRGRERRDADPEAAAKQRWMEARYTNDEPQALEDYLSIRDRNREGAISESTLYKLRMQQRVPLAAEMLGIQDERSLAQTLHHVVNSLTPDELALVELNRRGKLDEYAGKSRTKREEAARRAAALDQFGSVRGAPRIPGSDASGKKHIDFADWATLSPAARMRHKEAKDYEVVITNAPKHFDPATED